MSQSGGTSPIFGISGEEADVMQVHNIASFTVKTVNPPVINSGNATSLAMTKWINPWSNFNFEKISFPLYDGVCQFLGIPSNRPDFIKDYHFIGIMRGIDLYLSPTYSSTISAKTNGSGPMGPPLPSQYGN